MDGVIGALIDFSPPGQSWADYLETQPTGGRPGVGDLFDRWDDPKYICPAWSRNTTAAHRAGHVAESFEPGECQCGQKLRENGKRGLGKSRAYRAWIADLMTPEESDYFRLYVLNEQDLLHLAIVPALRAHEQFVRMLSGGASS